MNVAAPVLSEARSTTRRVARTFALACRLLPSELRDDVYLLYLVFRTLDDLVDDGRREAAGRLAAVEAWCDGIPRAETRETTILDDLQTRHPLPRAPLRDFCAGMRHDLSGAALPTEAAVDHYCYQVAGTVGLVMAHVLGTREPGEAHPAAIALGMAMQRTNILRDIEQDARAGRVYLATETVLRHGGLVAPGARERLMRDQIARADALYEEGCAGIGQLVRGRRAVAAAAAMYREILRQIERDGYGTTRGRAMVPRSRKLLLAARGGVFVR